MAICLLPARGRSLAAIIQLACRVPVIKSSPARRARIVNKKSQDHSRSPLNTREVSEGVTDDTLGPALPVLLMARCKTRKTFTSTRGRTGEYSSPATHVRQGSWGNVCVTRCMCEYSREHSRVHVQQETSYLPQAAGIIQYREGTPHRVLISVLIYSNPKNSSKKFLLSPGSF